MRIINCVYANHRSVVHELFQPGTLNPQPRTLTPLLVPLAQAGEDLDVFQGGGVALDFSAGGYLFE